MYLKLTNGGPVIYTLGQLRRDNPQTSFPKIIPNELLASYDVYPYTRPKQDTFDILAWRLIDDDFVQDSDSSWSLPYKLEPLPLEQAESNIRSRRDNLLQQTDWIVSRSYERGESVPIEWVEYRQALRDITIQDGFPYNVEWPTKPN